MEMDLELLWPYILVILISATSAQLPVADSMGIDGNHDVENIALSGKRPSSDLSNVVNDKENKEIPGDLSIIASPTTPSSIVKVTDIPKRKTARRSRRKSSRRSSRRRKRTKTRTSKSKKSSRKTSNGSKTDKPKERKSISSPTQNGSDRSVKVTTSSPLRSTMQMKQISTIIDSEQYKESTTPMVGQINSETEFQNTTSGESANVSQTTSPKKIEPIFVDITRRKGDEATFSPVTRDVKFDHTVRTPHHIETTTVYNDNSQRGKLALEMSNAPISVEGPNQNSFENNVPIRTKINTDKSNQKMPGITASDETQIMQNNNIATSNAFPIRAITSSRNNMMPSLNALPMNMTNKTPSIEPVEIAAAGDSVEPPTLRLQLPNQQAPGPMPIASVLARVLPYLAGILGSVSRRFIIHRVSPETVSTGRENSPIDRTIQGLVRRRPFFIQAIPVRRNFAMPGLRTSNRGEDRGTFLQRNPIDAYRQRVLCSETPSRLRNTCRSNADCQHSMGCYSGQCCATSDDHAERLGAMLERMNRRNTRRRIRIWQ